MTFGDWWRSQSACNLCNAAAGVVTVVLLSTLLVWLVLGAGMMWDAYFNWPAWVDASAGAASVTAIVAFILWLPYRSPPRRRPGETCPGDGRHPGAGPAPETGLIRGRNPGD